MSEYTYTDYMATVEAIAEEVIDDCGVEEENWHDRIFEEVDGNQYIIYYYGNAKVLEFSPNKDNVDWEEVVAMIDPKEMSREKMDTIGAFMAMEMDVYEACREEAEKREDEGEEDE